jgi:hypothetical protein
MANLVLRVAIALSIVGAAIGLTASASETMARCDPACLTQTSSAPDGAAVAFSTQFAQQATLLVILATVLVFVAIFAILLSYRLRPGGVRVRDR